MLVAELQQQTQISFDTETTDISPRCAEIVGYSFAWKPGEAFYVPVRGPEGDRVLDPARHAEALQPDPRKPGHRQDRPEPEVRHDRAAQRRASSSRGIAFDTMIADYLLDAGERTHNLDDLAQQYLDHERSRSTR